MKINILIFCIVPFFTSCQKDEMKANTLRGKWELQSLNLIEGANNINCIDSITDNVYLKLAKGDYPTHGTVKVFNNPLFKYTNVIDTNQTLYTCSTYEVYADGDSLNFNGFRSKIVSLTQKELVIEGQMSPCYYGYIDPLKRYKATFVAIK